MSFNGEKEKCGRVQYEPCAGEGVVSAAHKCTSEPAVKLEEDHAAGACSVRVGFGHGCVDDGIFVVVVVVASVR